MSVIGPKSRSRFPGKQARYKRFVSFAHILIIARMDQVKSRNLGSRTSRILRLSLRTDDGRADPTKGTGLSNSFWSGQIIDIRDEGKIQHGRFANRRFHVYTVEPRDCVILYGF